MRHTPIATRNFRHFVVRKNHSPGIQHHHPRSRRQLEGLRAHDEVDGLAICYSASERMRQLQSPAHNSGYYIGEAGVPSRSKTASRSKHCQLGTTVIGPLHTRAPTSELGFLRPPTWRCNQATMRSHPQADARMGMTMRSIPPASQGFRGTNALTNVRCGAPGQPESTSRPLSAHTAFHVTPNSMRLHHQSAMPKSLGQALTMAPSGAFRGTQGGGVSVGRAGSYDESTTATRDQTQGYRQPAPGIPNGDFSTSQPALDPLTLTRTMQTVFPLADQLPTSVNNFRVALNNLQFRVKALKGSTRCSKPNSPGVSLRE